MLSSYNYEYASMLPYWQKLDDLYKGEKVVKSKGVKYLPPSSGMIIDGLGRPNTLGERVYQAYKERADYINHVKTGVDRYVGLCHQSSPTIQLPKEMEYLRDKATKDGQSLESLLRMINTEQVKLGRCGLFADLNTSANGSKPYIAFYNAFSIINWNESDNPNGYTGLNMLVLHEVEHVCKDFTWFDEDRYRVCLLGDGHVVKDGDRYRQGVFIGDTFTESAMITPRYLGTTLDEIPFVFVNSCDCMSKPDYPPLDDLANTSLGAYRLSADYKQALHMQGQDTLVIKGTLLNTDNQSQNSNSKAAEDQGIRTGAGAVLNVGADGDAKFIGVSGDGIPEMRTALENMLTRCEVKSGNLLTNGSTFESGESLKTRLTAQTATLNQIALTGAFALQRILRIIAKWIGANEEEVVVQPNLEFSDFRSTGDDLVKVTTAIQLGFPMSLQSAYEYAQSKGYTKNPFTAEVEIIKKEKSSGLRDLLMPPQQLAESNSGLNPLNGNNAGNSKTQSALAKEVVNKTTESNKNMNDVEKVTRTRKPQTKQDK